jgi:hypothetical protein
MIHQTHPTWRALHLHDEKSIAYLNRMFRQGWYLVEIGVDGLDYLIMAVPVDTPERIIYKTPHHLLQTDTVPTMLVVVLCKGKIRNRQMAVITKRNDSGYFEVGSDTPPRDQWKRILAFKLTEELWFAIYERKLPEQEDAAP